MGRPTQVKLHPLELSANIRERSDERLERLAQRTRPRGSPHGRGGARGRRNASAR